MDHRGIWGLGFVLSVGSLTSLVATLVPYFCDWCAIYIAKDDGKIISPWWTTVAISRGTDQEPTSKAGRSASAVARDAPPMPRLHPNLAELYRQKVMNLAQALNDEHMRLEATECIRELIEEIRLVPDNGKLRVELYGELAALINLANEHPRSKGTGVQITLVAGAGFVQERTRWELRRLA